MKGALLILLVLVVCVIALFILQPGAKIAQGINKKGLLELKPGMTEEEVVARIGQPLYKEKSSGMLVYGEPSLIPGGGLEIGVMIRDGRVTRIYVEEYDLGVYRYLDGGPPTIWKPAALNKLP
jgi:hypothetical protein